MADLSAQATPELETQLVQDVERAVPGGAAAIFRCGSDHDVITRRAAGPRWRTAEIDPPGWLGSCSQWLAQGIRTAAPLVGRMMFDGQRPSDARVRELVQLPLVVDGAWWGTLLLLRPIDAARRAADVAVADDHARRFTSHLALFDGQIPRRTPVG